jgi:hypothetical protein
MAERTHGPRLSIETSAVTDRQIATAPSRKEGLIIISIASSFSQILSVSRSIMPFSSHFTVLTVILAIPASGKPIFRDAEASPSLSATQLDASAITTTSISTSQSATSPGDVSSLITSSLDTSASTIASISTGQHDASVSTISIIPTSPDGHSVSAITISTWASQQDASANATPSIPVSQQGASMSGDAM